MLRVVAMTGVGRTLSGCAKQVPERTEVASSIVSDPQGWRLLAFGVSKLAIARTTKLAKPGNDAVVLVRRAPEEGSQRTRDGALASWSQMDEQLANVGRLLPAGAVPRVVELPPSAELTAAFGSIIARHPVPDKTHVGARLPWHSECGSSAAWAAIDVHHRAVGAYAVEIKPYSAWSLDLRHRRGTPALPRMAPMDFLASLRAGCLVSGGSQAIYGFTAEMMREWLMSAHEEPAGLLQRRALSIGGQLRFRPSARRWAESVREIAARRGHPGDVDR